MRIPHVLGEDVIKLHDPQTQPQGRVLAGDLRESVHAQPELEARDILEVLAEEEPGGDGFLPP